MTRCTECDFATYRATIKYSVISLRTHQSTKSTHLLHYKTSSQPNQQISTMGRLATGGAAVFLAIGGFLFGYDSGIIASTIVQPYFTEYMGTPTSAETGGIVSSFTGGAVLGALSISYLADVLGRKKTV